MPPRPCPRCKQPLEIPQPAPAKVQCPRCKAVLRLSAPAAAGAASAAVAAFKARIKSNPDLALSMHDLEGAPLPPEAFDPFTLQDGAETAPLPRRRKSHAGGIMLGIVMLLVVAGVVVAYLMRNKETPPAAPSPNVPVAQLDLKRPPDMNQARINQAIEKGVDVLKKEIMTQDRLYHRSELADVAPANAHLGATALAGLTLLECGVSPDDPAVQKAAQSIRDGADQIHATYTLATAILFLDRLHANIPHTDGARLNVGERSTQAKKGRDRDLIRSFALRLMACQDVGGFWGYGRKVTKDEEEKTLQKVTAGQFAGEKLYYKNLSNSQFAALALWAARRHGVPVRPALQAVAKAARDQQTAEGTWNYDLNLPMKHTSACAGLIFLALERGLQEEGTARAGAKITDPKLNKTVLDDPAVKKGMEFLGKLLAKPPSLSKEKKQERQMTAKIVKEYYEKYENKADKLPSVGWTMDFAFGGTIFGGDSWGDLYLLWSIERVGVIYDVKEIHPGKDGTGKGGKDWYAWGSEIILANQKESGLWEDRFPGIPDTCFALLFLKRANIAKDLTDKLRDVMGWNAATAPPGNQIPMPPRKE
jgi:hypothetical protein